MPVIVAGLGKQLHIGGNGGHRRAEILTGKGGGQIASECDVEIRAPKSEFSDRAQEIHEKVIHSLVHYIELELGLA